MSGGQALPQQQQHQPFLNSPGSQLAHLFGFPNSTNGPSHHHHHNHNHQQQRIKLKRSRQRVDAGEPRNSYQGSMSRPSLQPRLLATGTGQLFGQSAPPPFPSDPTGLNGLLPHVQNAWLRLQKQQQQQQDNGAELERDTNELIKDDEEDEMTEMDRTPEDGGEPEEEALDLATVASPLDENGIVGEQPERTLEEVQQSPKSSKRKSFQPMRQIEQRQQMTNGDDHEEVDRTKGDEPEELKDDPMLNGSEDIEDKIVTVPTMANHQPPTLPETSSSSFAPGNNKFHELFSTLQQKLNLDYMKTNGIGPSVNNPRPLQISQPPPQLPQSVINKDYSKLVHTLKQEIIACLSGSIDKVVGEFAQAEAAAAAAAAMAAARAAAVVQHQQHQQQMEQQQQQQHRPPFFLHPLYHPYAGNPAAAAALFSASGQSSGIFPAAGFPFAGNSSVATLAANAAAAMRKVDDYSPLAPRKKRSKVTDTRLSKLPMAPRDDNSPRTPSNRDSPQLSGYFPPTMVGHPLYGSSSTFGNDTRDDSPINSDDLSDYGPCDGSMLQSSTLSSTHLRKAKLMFFYTRYPNSSLLKSYFPDIHFNKNNTAQLVKWFSNFREFFYIQMEKHARSALADQVRSRDEIVVTTDSDIYKQLNQHYNRNNHIQPPERLCHVIQETLREFFSAIQVGRDAEPSWKKSIYKVISRLDDPIPDYFKDPHFLERLEKP